MCRSLICAGLTTGERPGGRITLAVRSGSVALRLAVRLGSMSPSSPGIWSVFASIRSGITDPVDVRGVKSPVTPKSPGDSASKSPVTPESAIGGAFMSTVAWGSTGVPRSTSFGAGERPLSPRSVGVTSVMIEHSAIRGRSVVTSDEVVGAGPGGLPCPGMSSCRPGCGVGPSSAISPVWVGS